ncbi:MAG: hypothetical protein D6734_05430 [Candidatus Schekmanbacteria bacterium]|nr:MAG: hypothetical protein D6734_05430 [Candidatus Schekmanbacteria bacterium]
MNSKKEKLILIIVIALSVFFMSVIPFILISLIERNDIVFENCYLEEIKDSGGLAKVIIFSEKDIDKQLHSGEGVKLIDSENKEIFFRGEILEANKEDMSADGKKKFCLKIKISKEESERIPPVGKKVAIVKAGFINFFEIFS